MSELPMIGTVGISQETAAVIASLEAAHSTTAAHAAIDRLIVLDHAAHPRERALHQDAKRGNFRQEDDGARGLGWNRYRFVRCGSDGLDYQRHGENPMTTAAAKPVGGKT